MQSRYNCRRCLTHWAIIGIWAINRTKLVINMLTCILVPADTGGRCDQEFVGGYSGWFIICI